MRRIIDPLKAMGVAIEGTDGCAPLKIGFVRPLHLAPILPGQARKLACWQPWRDDETTIMSRPSRDHTERMLQAMGVQWDAHSAARSSKPSDAPSAAVPAISPLDATPPG
jgi:5-enolpyruvylshikimate-3-phosphate synthase